MTIPLTGTNRLDAIHLAPVDGVGAAAWKDTLLCRNSRVNMPWRSKIPCGPRGHQVGFEPGPHPTQPEGDRPPCSLDLSGRARARDRVGKGFSTVPRPIYSPLPFIQGHSPVIGVSGPQRGGSPRTFIPRKGRGAVRINRKGGGKRSASQFSPKGERRGWRS